MTFLKNVPNSSDSFNFNCFLDFINISLRRFVYPWTNFLESLLKNIKMAMRYAQMYTLAHFPMSTTTYPIYDFVLISVVFIYNFSKQQNGDFKKGHKEITEKILIFHWDIFSNFSNFSCWDFSAFIFEIFPWDVDNDWS